MAIRIAAIALAVPMIAFAAFLWIPGLDHPWGTFSFHFYVVSAASILAAISCLVLIVSARTLRETRVMFLALAFFALATFFSIHGITTPGFIFDAPSASLERSPWLATLAAGVFAFLSVVAVPGLTERAQLRSPEAVFIACASGVVAYFVVSLAFPDWLTGFPTQEEWFQHVLTAATISLLAFAAWRYFQSYLFARLPGQLALAVGLGFLLEAQVSLDFGEFWYYSWWMYHGLFLVAFLTVIGGWALEFARARDGRAIADGLAMRDALTQLGRGRPSDLVLLAEQIENHDPETSRHVDRVAALAFAIGRELGFGAAHLRELVLAAQMHDVGKIGLPPHILSKPEPLTDVEWAQIKQHPDKGWEIVSRARGLGTIATIIRHHHERFDGSGYPDGLAGIDIPIESRIISVADTFDALTSDRPYRGAMSLTAAREELQRVAGTQLDPDLVSVAVPIIDGRQTTDVTRPAVDIDELRRAG
jgi:HD-GYP domain-containing protein (c-di-GMP phosphodiesterase class II)